ncbi:MAG: choice-of-anchor A family protein, partial [Ignavibacteriales bacterium]|nr:choice-of-anchor A family protein [Ignavibacteriales bacterium]
TYDCGLFTSKVNIGDYVWRDTDKDGIQDAGETGMANVTVKLYDCNNNLIATTTTDSLGLYKFNNINSGSYYVQVTLPADYNFTLKNQGANTGKDSDVDPATGKTVCTPLTPGQTNLTLDAGVYFNKGSLGDKVWLDVNENGVQDNGETGVQNVTVGLYNCTTNALISSTTTNASGNYLFSNLAAGDFYVKFTAPAGYTITPVLQGSDVTKDSDADPVTGKTACVTLAAGDNNLTIDAGLFTSKVAVGDFVWKDVNQNGVQDAGEPGMAGVVVKLYDCNDNFIATTTTDSLGKYGFANLAAGSYYVQVIQPLGYTFTAKAQGGNTAKDSDVDPLTGKTACTALTAGTTNLTLDAGLYQPKASVGDKVWHDLNHDGVQDSPNTELGLSGVVVKLYDCSGALVSTTTTDQNGNYLFSNLTPGQYYVKFVALSGYAISAKNNIADTTIDSDADPVSGASACFTLAPGANDLTRDCGMYLNKVSIGDFVWKDINFNGIQDNGEAGLINVTVRLYDCSNNVIATTITNAAGYYSFPNLIPGDYYVQFYLPTGYSFSPKTQGSNVSVDSDPDVATGKTACVTLAPGTNVITWDAGMYETQSTFADISVTKSCDHVNAFNNEQVVYTITVTNNGPQSAGGITVQDNLPEGLIYLSSSPSGVYDTASGIWTVGTLASGASATLTVTLKVDVTNINNSVVDLGPAKEFNMFVLEDMTVPSSDTQGKLAVGRDASLQGYSVGDQLPNSNGTEDVLVVGHDLTFLTGRVYNGNVVYGNSTNLPRYSVSIDEGTLRKDTVVDFAAAGVYLRNLSTQLSVQPVNGTTTYQPFNEVTLVGTDPFINVFMVDGAKLSTANNTSITVPNGAVILVNVFGSNVSWGYGLAVNGTAYNNALFNFYEADSLYIHGIDVTGSILAPRAHTHFQAGVQHGQMICRSYRGQGQLNLDPFVGNLPVSKDIVNIAELKTSDRYDPDSSPANGNPTEDDYSGNTLHVGVVGNDGPNWRVVGNINNNNNALTIVNNATGSVLAGTSTGTVLTSTDNGTTWSNITGNMVVGSVRALAISGAKSSRVVAGTADGIYTTNNNGTSWDTTNIRLKDIRSIATAPDALGRMYAAAWDAGVYTSIDNGANWMQMNTGLTNLKVNAVHVTNNGDLLAATFGGGIFKYSVINSTWAPVTIEYPYVWALTAGSNGMLYAATYGGGVYKSEDGGDNWSKMNTGLSNGYIYSVSQDANNNLIAISWSGGVSTMDHGVNTWRTLGLDGAGISAVHVNSVSGTILVSAKNGSIYAKNGTLGAKGNETVPATFALSQNYPNPFNPATKINFTMPGSGHVSLVVYNILGQQVKTLVDADYNPGAYTVQFDGKDMASGIYIYRLTANKLSITKKMILVK